ncbi:calcium-binding protein [Microvirga sp. TS319]|uniref:calcium-binding protein n=1 Tax=Microvirga sp. TS319 TaxID=3241165 RepID=UPI00351A3B2F
MSDVSDEFTLTTSQVNEIEALLSAKRYAAAYRRVAELANGRDELNASIAWLKGAADVNENIGSQSAFIRAYTIAQYQTRYGENLDLNLLQDASDTIASKVLGDIIASRHVPGIADIAQKDAEPAATTIFNGDPGGWAGNPLFLFLGYDTALNNNILEHPADTCHALAMIKFVGSTGDWVANISNAWNAAYGSGSTATIASTALRVNSFLQAAYGGLFPAGGVLASDVVLGRVNADDVLSGSEGANFIHGGAGDDVLQASGGSDILDGGDGLDKADFSVVGSALNVIIKAIQAPTKHIATVVSDSGTTALYGVEEIAGSDQDDLFQLQSFAEGVAQLTLNGGNGVDQLSAIYLEGPLEVDAVEGQLKSGERVLGIRNFERFEGTNQDDKFIASGNEKEINGRGGRDTVDFSKATSGVHVSDATNGASGIILKNVELIVGSEQGDWIDLSGTNVGVEIRGGGGDDVLAGGSASDTLTGGAGGDTFIVGDGDIVKDPERSDRIKWGDVFLTGGTQSEEGAVAYVGSHGEEYTQFGSGLMIEIPDGSTVIVENWSNGDGGIILRDRKEGDPPEPPLPPGARPVDPLVLDLDGDGIELYDLSDSGAYFDLDCDGLAERTGWVRPDDALLAFDRNGNGIIDDLSELIGGGALSSALGYGSLVGFRELGLFDSNFDTVIDSQDVSFSQILVWRDRNGDGFSQASELGTLASHGIARLSLIWQPDPDWIEGSRLEATSTFTRTDGSQSSVSNAFFTLDRQVVLDPGEDVTDPGNTTLPNLQGRGDLKDLHLAMKGDPVLRQMVSELAGLAVADAYSLAARINALMYKWAGIETADTFARGEYVDAALLRAFEKFTGSPFLQGTELWMADERADAGVADQITQYWQDLKGKMLTQILAQTDLGQQLFPGLSFRSGIFLNLPQGSQLGSVLDHLRTYAPAGELAKLQYWSSMFLVLEACRSQFSVDDWQFKAAVEQTLAVEGVELSYEQILGSLVGTGESETLVGSFFHENLLVGGGGNDLLRGGVHDDTYLFGRGFGIDTIREYDGIGTGGLGTHELNRVRFTADVLPDEVVFRRENGTNHLVVEIGGTGDRLTILDQLTPGKPAIERFEFADGTAIEWWDVYMSLSPATEGADYLVGANGRNDTLDGGAGDDTLEGGTGADTYIFGRGSGSDTIIEKDDGRIDRVLLGADVTPADLILARDDITLDLIVRISGSSDRLTIKEAFSQNGPGIEEFVFADGTVWDRATIRTYLLAGTPLGDLLTGFSSADTLDGGAGNDTLKGGSGADTYIFGRGYGQDVIDDGASSGDILILADGVAPDDLVLSQDSRGNDLILTIAGTQDTLTIRNQFLAWYWGVSEIRFADGTRWSQETIRAKGLVATSENDVLIGYNGVSDYLEGGLGDDYLAGRTGRDTYIYNIGDGNDTIGTSNATSDSLGGTLILGAGLTIASVSATQSASDPYDITLNFRGTDGSAMGSILLEDFGGRPEVDRIVFGDGQIWTQADVYRAILDARISDGADTVKGFWIDDLIAAGAGDDVIEGGSGNDTLIGGFGNDKLIGNNGSDTYVYTPGDGDDTISDIASESGAVNRLVLGSGLVSSHARLIRSTSDVDDLRLEFISDGDEIVGTIVLDEQFSQSGFRYGVDEIVFGNGEVWSRETLFNNWATLAATEGGNEINGDPLSNHIDGGAGSDTIKGFAGDDTLIGGTGDDWLDGGAGSDTYRYNEGDGSDTIAGSSPWGTDHLILGPTLRLSNLIVTRSMQDVNDAILSFQGSDGFIMLDGQFSSDAAIGVEKITFGDGQILRAAQLRAMILSNARTDGSDVIQAFGGDDVVSGGLGDDTLDGLDGEDWLLGGEGHDELYAGNGQDTLNGGQGDDLLNGGQGGDTYGYNINEGSDTITDPGSTSSPDEDILFFGPGIGLNDLVFSRSTGDRNDLYIDITSTGQRITVDDQFYAPNSGIERFQFSGGDSLTIEQIRQQLMGATDGDDTIYGFRGVADLINGGLGNDTIIGFGGSTTSGGAGDDTLLGGLGDDTYIFEGRAIIVENAGEGIDTVQSSVSYTLAANVENLILTGTSGISGTGNELANVLAGNSGFNKLSGGGGDDTLDGGSGSDTLIGGLGYDTYVVDRTSDVITELTDEGTDTVLSSVTLTLAANVENLTLTGTTAISGTGNTLDNVLVGNASSNTLDGGAGIDTLIGGAGNDIYVVDNGGDVIVEAESADIDTVQSSASSYILAANVENLALTGTAAISGTGNALSNLLTGNAGANTLDGGAGQDTLNGGAGADLLIGGEGNDTYVVDNGGDLISENAGEGTDTVQSSASYTLAANVENLTLMGTAAISGTGNGLANVLTGNSAANTLNGDGGDDILNGGAGVDTLVGGLGNDTYIVESASDIIAEALGEGTDTVQSSVSLTLGANLENLMLTGTATTGTGNALDNVLLGNAANNTLNGGAGADTLTGGLGNDTYVIDNTGDTVIELGGEGIDTVQSSVSYTLAANIENLTLTGTSAINGTGNELANALTGNSGANVLTGGAGDDTLNGGTGADTLSGGTGDDIYIVDNAGDVVIEAINEGIDTVQSSVSFTLSAFVENLTLTGIAASGTGNALDNVLIGNSGANTLNGGAGADQMSGGAGNDTYIVDDIGDGVMEAASAGTDTVQSAIGYVLGANLENLTLTGTAAINGTGNELANVLTGNSGANMLEGGIGDDTLNGGAGNDLLSGGVGNDTYIVDSVADMIVEAADEGTDTVQSSITLTVGANLENLTLTGTAAIHGTGNGLNNVLTGNSGANTLDGREGADQMSGGLGNDIYVVDDAGDVVIEAASQGTDTVQSSISHGLAANVENLTLIGTSAINGTGNTLNNVMIGNAATNILFGGAGNDTLTGGAGSDVFAFTTGFGKDVVTDFQAGAGSGDVIEFSTSLFADVTTVLAAASQVGSDVVITVDTSNTITLKNVQRSSLHADDFRFV